MTGATMRHRTPKNMKDKNKSTDSTPTPAAEPSLEDRIARLIAGGQAPKEYIAAALKGYIAKIHGGVKPTKWGQIDHCRFLLWLMLQGLPQQTPEWKNATFAVLCELGLGGNASQFRQNFASDKNGALLPSKETIASTNLGF
jgi:hypothetical protein